MSQENNKSKTLTGFKRSGDFANPPDKRHKISVNGDNSNNNDNYSITSLMDLESKIDDLKQQQDYNTRVRLNNINARLNSINKKIEAEELKLTKLQAKKISQ